MGVKARRGLLSPISGFAPLVFFVVLLGSACVYRDKDGQKPSSDRVDWRLQRWEGKLEDSGEVVTTGCRNAGYDEDLHEVARFQAAPGQMVTWTVRDRYVIASLGDPPPDLCALEDEIPHYNTTDLECWEFIEGGPVRVAESEILPSERKPIIDQRPDRVPGSGRRLLLEVLKAGIFTWKLKDSCDSNWYPPGSERHELEILPFGTPADGEP